MKDLIEHPAHVKACFKDESMSATYCTAVQWPNFVV